MPSQDFGDRVSIGRRAFMHRGALYLAGAAGLALAEDHAFGLAVDEKKERRVRFGLITDLHYADKKPAGTRHYREAPGKLREAVERFRKDGAEFLVETGDLVDAADDAATEITNRSPLQIDRALVRPAWSLSWLMGEPALHVELESPSGRADGTLRWNAVTSWVGTIRDARPELPPIADWIPTGGLEGRLEATLDVSVGELGLEGLVEFQIRDGSISLPDLGVPLPFESLTGAISLGGDAYAKLTSLSFEGPVASGSGSGKIGRAERLEQAPIGFEFQLDIKPGFSRAVSTAGVRVNPGGDAVAIISGTVAKPKIR